MKSKNTVLTRYFWDKMSTVAQNLQAELNALALNPAFVANFIDDVSFVLGDSTVETKAPNKESIETEEKAAQPLASTPVKSAEKQPEPEVLTTVGASLVKEEAINEDRAPILSDHKGKVVVITPSKPTDMEISFLNKILAAVAVDKNAVHYIERTYAARELASFNAAKIILSFGAVIDFVPDHQVRSKSITVIISKSLAELEQDQAAKKKLWESMKGFFK